jgi:S1-C subfamily serine protease
VQPVHRLFFPGIAVMTLSLGGSFFPINNTFSANVAEPAPTPSSAIGNSVVKVFATVRYPDFYKPWARQAPADFTGSGVVIEGKRILTNAHVVLYSSQVQVQVQANQAGNKILATVEAIATGIDLAVLKLDDETFFDSHPAIPQTKTLPAITDALTVYGYPVGGTSLALTKGIVSRIEFAAYHYPVSGLKIQIDAALDEGDSGGPAVANNRMIGLAFSHLSGSENTSYITPIEEIELFLKDTADGHYDGKPAMYDSVQTLENPALRAFLKLDKNVTGIVVHQPESDDASYPLKEWDLITRIGATPIDDQGMTTVSGKLRVRFTYLVQKIARNGRVPLTILRRGKELRVDLPVSPNRPRVIPDLSDSRPSYFVFGPLIFSEATAQLLEDYAGGNKAADWLLDLAYLKSPLLTRASDSPAVEGERLVFVSSPFVPHKLAKGYSNPSQQVVKSVNGQRIKNLAHLVELLRDSKDEFVRFEFDVRGGETPVFSRAEMIAATNEILSDNAIPSQGSPDVMAIWNAKPPAR